MTGAFDVSVVVIGGLDDIGRLIVGEKTVVAGIDFDHPELGEIGGDVGIRISAPLFVGAADLIDADVFLDFRCIM